MYSSDLLESVVKMKEFDLHIHTNTDCNLRCRHCYNDSGVGAEAHIAIEDVIHYLRFFNTAYKSDIHLEGGEIFLYPDLLVAMNKVEDEILKRITITTNGTIRNEDPSVIHMLRRIGNFRVSIEGHTQEIHGLVRNSDLRQVLRYALYYQEQKIPVTLRMTLHAGNQDTIFTEGIPYLSKLGFARFQIYEFQPVGRGAFAQMSVTRDFKQILRDFSKMQISGEAKLMLSTKRIQDVRKEQAMLADKGVEVNYLKVENSLSVSAEGDMAVCPWQEQDSIGNIFRLTEKELTELLEEDIYVHECSFCSRVFLRKVNV